MPPMIRTPAFRLFLMLALLLNGLLTAHAAVGHALMALPVQSAPAVKAAVAVEGGEESCHDMAGHAASDAVAPDPMPDPGLHDHHNGSSCCQGTVCNCACAVQLPVSPSLVSTVSRWQALPLAGRVEAYLSVTPSLILRPPIA